MRGVPISDRTRAGRHLTGVRPCRRARWPCRQGGGGCTGGAASPTARVYSTPWAMTTAWIYGILA